MQKVRILAETVTIFSNIVENTPLTLKSPVPFVRAIVRLGRLQPTKNALIVIGDASDFLNSDRAVQRIVGIESVRI